jgi:hypothetical protein
MDNGFLPSLKAFIGRHKYLIVFVLFLVIILLADDSSLVKRAAQRREIRALREQLESTAGTEEAERDFASGAEQ